MSGHIAEIRIQRAGMETNLGGLRHPEEVRCLRVYSGRKNADLDFLAAYPNVTRLFLRGSFAGIGGVSALAGLNSLTLYLSGPADFSGVRGLALKDLTASCPIDGDFSLLLSESLESLELTNIRKLADLSFLEGATGLRKLYLNGLPGVEVLPDLGKLPNLYGLKLYELHKLCDIESLSRSAVRYFAAGLTSDKLSGTKLAEVLLRMERLERANLRNLDRGGFRRYTVLENCLKRAGKEQLLDESLDMTGWTLL